ncbi:MAG: Mur ligase family protein, partial [Defluviitaleaceae bacterium]|nr:Mur ligase family protein [Defluviitaleaceae bacterium]
MDLYGKTVLVCGMGRSGAGAAGLLRRNSAIVTLQDINESPNFGENFDPAGYNTYFGKNPDDILENFDMLVVSPGVPTGLPFFAKAQKLGIPLIGEMELAAAYCKAPILAITGTNGKTTTTSLLGAIIAAKNPQSPTVGNIGVAFSNLADSIPADALVAAEVSSFQLETIRDFRPLVSAVLNISRD